MNTSPTLRPLFIWLFAALLGVALTLAPASASVDPDESLTSIHEPAEARLEADNSPDISVFGASQCLSGNFCVWSGAGYTGNFKRFSTQSQYLSMGWNSIGSFYNNRSKRVFIYGDSSGSPSACYGAQAKRSTVSGFLVEPSGVYLSTAASC